MDAVKTDIRIQHDNHRYLHVFIMFIIFHRMLNKCVPVVHWKKNYAVVTLFLVFSLSKGLIRAQTASKNGGSL